jgi:hypothetical protein
MKTYAYSPIPLCIDKLYYFKHDYRECLETPAEELVTTDLVKIM